MDEALILETTYLIDLEREAARRQPGPATAFLEGHAEARLHVTFTVAGEIAAGASLSDRARWEAFLAPFRVLGCDRDVCWEYGRAYRYLSDNGLLIGANDLWIAATAKAHGLPVVTRNEKHFRRVPGLEVRSYGPPA